VSAQFGERLAKQAPFTSKCLKRRPCRALPFTFEFQGSRKRLLCLARAFLFLFFGEIEQGGKAMKANFAYSINRLAGAAIMLAALAWAAPAWGQANVWELSSQDRILNPGESITADIVRLNNSHLTAPDNNSITANSIFLFHDGHVTAKDGSKLDAQDIVFYGGELTAIGSDLTAKNLYIDNGELTATAGSKLDVHHISVAGNFNQNTSRLTAAGSTLNAGIIETGLLPMGYSYPYFGPEYDAVLTLGSPDTSANTIVNTTGRLAYINGRPHEGADGGFGLLVGTGSRVRVAGDNVFINNKYGARFFNDSTLDVGIYELNVTGALSFANGSTYILDRNDSTTNGKTIVGNGKVTIEKGPSS
jgi:hypothetical protein